MHKRVLVLTTSALIFAYGAGGAIAQDRMTPQADQQHAQHHPAGQEGAGTMGPGGTMACGMMGQGGMMGRGMMGGGMMGRGTMGAGGMGPPMMMRIIFALMDSDGDGTVELPRVSGGSRTNFQGNGSQQRWPAYSGRDASVHAGDQELGDAAISLFVTPHFSGREHQQRIEQRAPMNAPRSTVGGFLP